MRISDWSSDVCSSDLINTARQRIDHARHLGDGGGAAETRGVAAIAPAIAALVGNGAAIDKLICARNGRAFSGGRHAGRRRRGRSAWRGRRGRGGNDDSTFATRGHSGGPTGAYRRPGTAGPQYN